MTIHDSRLDPETILEEKAKIIDRYGEWTAHNIQLAPDIFTISPNLAGDEVKLRRIIRIISDLSPKSFPELRVLDLACLEGLYAIEAARRGAEVVAIEGREPNLAKAKFAKRILGLEGLKLYQDDVRNLSVEKYGRFDVVLCLGIFYHLDHPDLFHFAEKIAEVCSHLVIFDTHISLNRKLPALFGGREYRGRKHRECNSREGKVLRGRDLWTALDNPKSFWLTKPSLLNLLAEVGFTSIYECLGPFIPGHPRNRVTLVAVKGHPLTVMTTPQANDIPRARLPERPSRPGCWRRLVNFMRQRVE